MKTISLPTALVIVAAIAATAVLLALGKPIPAGVSSALGTLLAGMLPALLSAPAAPVGDDDLTMRWPPAAARKPTIAELEAMMKEHEGGSVQILPDGSVHAVPPPKADP